jgi:hypothetical protein
MEKQVDELLSDAEKAKKELGLAEELPEAVGKAESEGPGMAGAVTEEAENLGIAGKVEKVVEPEVKTATAIQDEAKRLAAAEEQKLLDMRIAAEEAKLNPARQATLDYRALRKSEGKSLKGGDIKKIYNVKEQIWILKRQKAYPDRLILEQAEIIGVRMPDGTIRTANKGLILDFVEVRGSKVVGGDLKSSFELQHSIKGGVKRPTQIMGEIKESSKIGIQHQAEKAVLQEALQQGGKIVIKGKNVKSGVMEIKDVHPNEYVSEIITYEDVLPN